MMTRVSHGGWPPSYSHLDHPEFRRCLYVTVFFSLLSHHQCNVSHSHPLCERPIPVLSIDVAGDDKLDRRIEAVLPTQLPKSSA